MKDVILITNYYHFETERSSSRYRTLAEMIANEKSINLEVVTSSFYHRIKKQRVMENIEAELPFRVRLLYEGGYKKNISLKRLKSSREFSRSVLHYLKHRKVPDLIYLVIPSLDVAAVVSKYADENSVPLMIDIQDLWPETFRMVVDIPLVSDLLFAPMMRMANQVYAKADQIIAVSETYVRRGMSVNHRCKEGMSVYIGSDISYAKKMMESQIVYKPAGEFWITYVGILGYNYDIELVIDALAILMERGISKIVFQVCGNGELMEKFQAAAKCKQVSAVFHGHTDYGCMMKILSLSDAAVNPIIGKAVGSITNKVADYAVAGTPVVNTQPNNEYRQLLDEYEAGINCPPGNVVSVADAIERLYYDEERRARMHENALHLGKSKFSRRDTYGAIVDKIKAMMGEKHVKGAFNQHYYSGL